MNLNLDIKNLTDRETFEGLIDTLGGEPLSTRDRARKDTKRALDAVLPEQSRPCFIAYADAVADSAGAREDAVLRVGLLLGLGTGVAMNAYPDREPGALARVATDMVAVAISSEVGPAVAQDVCRLVLRALARVTDEPAAL